MTTSFERFATSLRATYRLLSPLGSGGAAHVYLAEDVKSGQRVAIKVLREEQATTISADRFLAEIDIVAQLEHPNIVPIYASGAENGLPYFVMPFLEGQSLRARLTEAGRLPLDEVLQICADVSAAIDYAHRRLVVHRDIKPENVLLHDGQAFVLDFGIALALDTIAHPRRTVPGSVPGTPAYMSPEQARGETRIDGWSDVYSFACVVYEMISGSPPFTGPWPVVLHRHMSAEPIPLGCRMPSIPHGLSAAVSRALAKEPSERFLTTGELVRAMRADTHSPERRRPNAIGGSLGPSCGFFFESRRFA
jgi:serine/threonine-protein kinase